ncbi:biliverdin-producing heme oxygenase [Aestuariivirga sp. YIM B02566]|uniref:biliverdin-producing heme oxygenase n=1 Tax=Taklimakanibacter albus TaxID=2800327 RepID=UPI001AEEF974|nr:biliverdin-producing heme oxygenase [Aestuariivirga sp. YIM B02566]
MDALYSRYDLGTCGSYGEFLQAQYRAVAAAEKALKAFPALPTWRQRADLVATDLRSLGIPLPVPLSIDLLSSPARAHGLLYVTEGSRLGGRLLLRAVADDLPTRFLEDGHHPGEWRRLLAACDQFANEHTGAIEDMLAGAEAGFHLFAEAAVVTVPGAAR